MWIVILLFDVFLLVPRNVRYLLIREWRDIINYVKGKLFTVDTLIFVWIFYTTLFMYSHRLLFGIDHPKRKHQILSLMTVKVVGTILRQAHFAQANLAFKPNRIQNSNNSLDHILYEFTFCGDIWTNMRKFCGQGLLCGRNENFVNWILGRLLWINL